MFLFAVTSNGKIGDIDILPVGYAVAYVTLHPCPRRAQLVGAQSPVTLFAKKKFQFPMDWSPTRLKL